MCGKAAGCNPAGGKSVCCFGCDGSVYAMACMPYGKALYEPQHVEVVQLQSDGASLVHHDASHTRRHDGAIPPHLSQTGAVGMGLEQQAIYGPDLCASHTCILTTLYYAYTSACPSVPRALCGMPQGMA